MKKKEKPKVIPLFTGLPSLLDLFRDEAACYKHLAKIRWKDGYVCPHCGAMKKPYILKTGYKCAEKECYQKFSLIKGTIFENTKIPLRIWFAAVYFSACHTYGINSRQLAKNLGISQKTGWFVLHRIREAYRQQLPKEYKLKGIVEVDEVYIGGKVKNFNVSKRKWIKTLPTGTQGRSTLFKTPVAGVIERGGLLVTRVLPNVNADSLKELIRELVDPGSLVITDDFNGYNWVHEEFWHIQLRHKGKNPQFAVDDYHMNNIEGFWGRLRRGMNGTFHQTDYGYLQRYMDEFTFRYNHRHLKPDEMFDKVLSIAAHQRISLDTLQNEALVMKMYLDKQAAKEAA